MKALSTGLAKKIFNTKGELMLLFVFLAIFLPTPARALLHEITATGGWTETVNASDLVGGAGTNLNSTYTSASNATLITVTQLSLLGWQVTVHRTDVSWRSEFHLYVQRTGNGGRSCISGGGSYQEITTSAQLFFSCGGLLPPGVENLPVQYRLTGMSLSIPPGTYSTTVTYTVSSL